MGEHWTDRLIAEAALQGMALDQLDLKAGLTKGRARQYKSKRNDAPRGDTLARYAAALGVELLWLRDGIEPRRPGDSALGDINATADEILHRREVAERIAGARKRRGIMTVEAAAIGTVIRSERWRRIEAGDAAPTSLELRVISERLWTSLDWLVSGHLTPIDDREPVAEEKARRYVQESTGSRKHDFR